MAKSLCMSDIPMKCGVGVHPSFLVEGVHRGSEEDLVKQTGTKPILLLPAGNDSPHVKVGGKHIRAIAEARGVPESTISVEFPTMKHGWVIRGDGTNAEVAKCQEEAMGAIVKFLGENHSSKKL